MSKYVKFTFVPEVTPTYEVTVPLPDGYSSDPADWTDEQIAKLSEVAENVEVSLVDIWDDVYFEVENYEIVDKPIPTARV